MSEIVEKLKQVSVRRLDLMLQDVLTQAEKGVVDEIGGFLSLSQNREEILSTFTRNMNFYFDELMGKEVKKPEPVHDYETLSLVKDDDLEIMVALEGMINAARNAQLPSFISFNTRLNALFEGRNIDESTNPLDPSQVAEAFKEGIQPLGLDAQKSLSVYRRFNTHILRQLDEVLSEANHLLIEHGVIPNLGMDGGKRQAPVARSGPRSSESATGFGAVEEGPHAPDDENPELFSMMQNLLHPEASATGNAPLQVPPGQTGHGQQYAVPSSLVTRSSAGPMQPFTPAPGEAVQMVDQAQLMAILTNIQRSLDERSHEGHAIPKDLADVEKLDIPATLGEMLQVNQEAGKISAVDRQSSDIINLVTMLYEAIWEDESVPIPIKELIGRTQITIIKVALSDQTFFNKENHPARAVLNEFAEAGIGWTEVEALEDDPLYKKIQELVHKILVDYTDDIGFFEEIVKDFRTFRAREAAKTRVLEQRILRARERQDRLEDIHELVTQKIDERLLGRDLHSFVQDMLEGPFHKFMVMLVLKEGPGTNAWKQAINTIDVLLWTVQPHEHEGDRDRLATVNARLLNNLRKAFRIGQLEADEIDQLITRLKEVQEESFGDAEASTQGMVAAEGELDLERTQHEPDAGAEAPMDEPEVIPGKARPEELTDDDPHVQQVDNLHVGVWVEFLGEDNISIRCKLAALISAIDKYIFVNRQGVKVVEKTRNGLAQELKDGTVKIISDGLLFSRALESVIGNLREAQHEQQTGGAYQPGSREENTA